ncbi:MAG: CHAT domain-containing protein [Acetobacteraceae bacterium]
MVKSDDSWCDGKIAHAQLRPGNTPSTGSFAREKWDILAKEIAARLLPLCPTMTVVRYILYKNQFCARADHGWRVEIGLCDAVTDANEAAFGKFVSLWQVQKEAVIRGWTAANAQAAYNSYQSLLQVDSSDMFVTEAPPRHSPKTSSKSTNSVLDIQELLSARRYKEVIALLEPLIKNRSLRDPMALAEAYEGAGRPAEALELLQSIQQSANDVPTVPGAQPAYFDILFRIASLYERNGSFEGARDIYNYMADNLSRREAANALNMGDFPNERGMFMRHGLLAWKQSYVDAKNRKTLLSQANDFFEKAMRTSYLFQTRPPASKIPDPILAEFDASRLTDPMHLISFTASAWARVAYENGDRVLADKLSKAALNELSKLPFSTPFKAELEIIQAGVKQDLALFDAAIKDATLTVGREDPLTAFALTEKARALEAQGRDGEALENAITAGNIVDAFVDRLSGDTGLDARAELAASRRTFDTYFRIAHRYADSHPQEARTILENSFAVAQLAQETTASRALSQTVARIAVGSGETAKLLRQRQDLVEEWKAADQALLDLTLKPEQQQDKKAIEAKRRLLDQLTARRKEADATLQRSAPELANWVRPRPLPLARAQSVLEPDEAIILFYLGEDQSYLWVVGRENAAWHSFPLSAAQMNEEVATLRAGLDPSLPFQSDFDQQAAYKLYRTIFGAASSTLETKHHLLIAPTGALQSLPFSVLITEPPTRSGDAVGNYTQAEWLIKKHSLTTLSAVNDLILRKLPSAEGKKPFLGIGDPVLRGTETQMPVPRNLRGVADTAAIDKLARLQGSSEEIKNIAAGLGAGNAAVLVEKEATEARVKALSENGFLADTRIILFATHGLVANEVVGVSEPALVLTPPAKASEQDDGLLTASEITYLKLNSDWVVLSACNTAAGKQPGAENLSGLARSFLYAGSRSLLVSHWPVYDKATSRLMVSTFSVMQSQSAMRPADALREAMLGLIGDPDYSNPRQWAPFVLIGGNR